MAKTPLFRYLRRSFDLARVALHTGESAAEVVDRWRDGAEAARARISRRRFLATTGLAGAGLAACDKLGKLGQKAPAEAEKPAGPRETVAIGAGVAGLTAA